MSQPIPSLADAIAWAEQLAAATAREAFTRVETGRMEAAEGERQKRLARAIVHHLRQYQHAGPATLAAAKAVADVTRPQRSLVVRLECGDAWHQDAFINAALILTSPAVLDVAMSTIRSRALAVMRQGTGVS